MPMHDWTRVDAGIYPRFPPRVDLGNQTHAKPRVTPTRLLCPCRASGCRGSGQGSPDVARPDGRHGLQRRGCRDSGTSQDDVLHRTPRRVQAAQEKHGGSSSRQRGSHCRHRQIVSPGKQKQCQLLPRVHTEGLRIDGATNSFAFARPVSSRSPRSERHSLSDLGTIH